MAPQDRVRQINETRGPKKDSLRCLWGRRCLWCCPANQNQVFIGVGSAVRAGVFSDGN